MSEDKTQQKTVREPQALTTEYHKARKQLLLWAGILFIWELVGIDLAKAEATGGNVGAIISAIKSPQAVPWVLMILVVYFLFKTTIEWYQCNPARRALRVSRVDFTSAWLIPLLAFALLGYQAIRRVQFADRVFSPGGGTEIFSLLVLPAITLVSKLFKEVWRKPKGHPVRRRRIVMGGVGLFSIISGFILIIMGRLNLKVGMALTVLCTVVLIWDFFTMIPLPERARGQ